MFEEGWIDELLEEEPLKQITHKLGKTKIRDVIHREYVKEISRPPKIAIIGAAGVGKTSTINALFGTNLPVSHDVAGTLSPTEVSVGGEKVEGAQGDLILYDMPGIDEDLDKVEQYARDYREIISQCDAAVWVLSAESRRMATDMAIIRDVVRPANKQVASRLVIGVNKADLAYPQNWNTKANLPSKEQEKHLQKRVEDIQTKLSKVCPEITEDRIVVYSATRHYRLLRLFGAMLRACPKDRAWVLNSRQEIADYWEKVSPELRQLVQVSEGGYDATP